MARDSYDKATAILRASFPARAAGDETVNRHFPAFGAADRVMAGAGLIPKGTRGGAGGALFNGGRRDGRGIYPGPRTARGPAARSVAQELISSDAAAAAASGGPVVDIRVWAGKLGEAGVPSETIYGSYEAAGGDAALSAQQQAGETSGFLSDFVGALEGAGVSAEVVVGTYQEAGGRIGR